MAFATKTRLALAASILAFAGTAAAAQAPTPGVAHPAMWPQAHSPAALTDPATEKMIAGLLPRMSVEEKVGQIIQGDTASIKPDELRQYPLGSILSGGNSPPLGAPDRAPPAAWIATSKAYRDVSLEQRPGHVPIPTIYGIDVIHGNSNVVGATLFPHNIGLGAMHDLALVEKIGRATAEETAATGVDWAFGPTIATVRDDRWGRVYEGYSEDPGETAAFARAMVRGLQGDPSTWPAFAKGYVAASAKHFLGDGGTDGKDQGNNVSSEAALVRITAPAYAAAIDAGTMTIMASYNSWQGAKMHGNKSLLTDVLKKRMGFDGFVVGDWNAHGQLPGCTNVHCPQAINAGLDMFMAPDGWKTLFDNTLADVKAGTIGMARLDDAVRRILRVKARLGLFDPARPLEAQPEIVGSAAHRALAREAVAKSLVLLKNDGGVLPIRGTARILVAGDGADNLGKQTGGWTLSWQGTGNAKADFPGATSIGDGIAQALRASGGSAEIRADGRFTTRPDAAILVIGEEPYAEFQGDIATLQYQPGEHFDLELVKRLKSQGIPVVIVFLSGRPMWTNPEINAADAFVAAWLPGSEGAGVADVLVGDAGGKPRRDFTGHLSFSWPRTAAQYTLNQGDSGYDPLFPIAFGRSYADRTRLPDLSEASGVSAAVVNVTDFFTRGRVRAPWRIALGDGGGIKPADRMGLGASPRGVVTVEAVDAGGVQEAGRRITFNGRGRGSVAVTGTPVDLARQANGDVSVQIVYRLEGAAPGVPVILSFDDPTHGVDIASTLRSAAGDASLKIPINCFKSAGADITRVSMPIRLETAGALRLTLVSASLSGEPAGAVCPR